MPQSPARGGIVQQLCGPSGAQFDEALKRCQIVDINDGSHIPFEPGGGVGVDPGRRVGFAIEDGGPGVAEQGSFKAHGMFGKASDLAPRSTATTGTPRIARPMTGPPVPAGGGIASR